MCFLAEIVSGLEVQLKSLRNDYKSMEQKAQSYKDEINRVENNLQRQMEKTLREKSQNEADMNQLITELQDDKKTIEAKFETKVKDQLKTITGLVNKLNSKELLIDKTNREMKSLQKKQNVCQDEYENTIQSLQHNIERLEIKSQQVEHEHHEAIESIQNEIVNKDEDVNYLQNELDKVHEVLDDRTKLLGNMVEQNKTVFSDLEEARALVTELQDESEIYLRSKEKVEFLIHKREAEFKEKETFYQKKLKEEKQMYEEKVKEIGSYKKMYKEAKALERESSESQKEIVVLKDKIKRQENYIRKLQEKNSNSMMNAGNRRTSVGTSLKMVKANER